MIAKTSAMRICIAKGIFLRSDISAPFIWRGPGMALPSDM